MERIEGGYTIVEVMIVLAVSSLLFFSAMIVVGGQSGQTNFNQAMQDVKSKIQNYVSQVSASSYPGSEAYSCSASTGRPLLSTTTPGVGSDCIFVGRAIQAPTGQSKLFIYTVLADATQPNSSCTPALTISCSNPEPAISGSSYVLLDTYQIGGGAKIVSSKATTSLGTNESDLVGIYAGLQNDASSSSSGTAALIMKSYPCNTSTNNCPINLNSPNTPQAGFGIKDCIEEANTGSNLNCSSPPLASKWVLCMSDGSNSSGKTQIIVNNAPGGITTQVSFASCS